jgi:leader peptidase (prepilin peptidase)/N-methyltransferase
VTETTVHLVILALFGLAIGSFLNVVIHRVPRKQSLTHPPSRCPSCGTPLRWFDNVPVLGYAWLGGKCRACRAPISIRYPIVELITMLVFLAHYPAFGWTPLLVVRLLFACALIALFAIDLEHHLLPDVITLPGIVVGLACSLFLPPGILAAFIGALAGGGILWLIGEAYFRYSGQEGMGGGDVKMLGMIGAFLGWQQVALTLVLSSVAGSIVGILMLASRRGGLKYELPYGTFLALAALAASLVGERIVTWYTGLYA